MRWFLYHNLIYYLLMIGPDIIIRIIIPRYNQIRYIFSPRKSFLLANTAGSGAQNLLSFANVAITAYVHLPPDSIGFRGGFRGLEQDDNEIKEAQPLTLSLTELSSHHTEGDAAPVSIGDFLLFDNAYPRQSSQFCLVGVKTMVFK